MGDGEGDEFAAVPEREEELVLVEDRREKESLVVDWYSPVACVVSVAVYESDFDAVVEKVGQVLEPAVTRVIADTSESSADGARTLRPVQRHAHGLLHVLLVEETLVERWRSRSRVQRSNIIVVASAVQNIRVKHVAAAETLSCLTDFINSLVHAQVLRIADSSEFATLDDLVFAGAGAFERVCHVEVLRLVDGLDVVGVVVGHCWVGGPLDEAVDAAVDDHQGVDVQDGVLAVVVDEGAVFDALVLLFEIGGEGGAVAATLERR